MATEEDRINTGVLLTIGAVLAIATVGVALAITALVRSESEQMTSHKGSTANLRPVQELRDEHERALSTEPEWFDQAAGQVSIPIERAVQLVLEDIKRDPSKATALAPPAPDAGAAEPAQAGDAAAAEAADGGAPDGASAAEEATAGDAAPAADDGGEAK
jgi:hypothetical protein